ncbi:MAG: hypothetical protein ABEH64_07090, partial [Salinirussus sp.]
RNRGFPATTPRCVALGGVARTCCGWYPTGGATRASQWAVAVSLLTQSLPGMGPSTAWLRT